MRKKLALSGTFVPGEGEAVRLLRESACDLKPHVGTAPSVENVTKGYCVALECGVW
jgi:hypothetical protein